MRAQRNRRSFFTLALVALAILAAGESWCVVERFNATRAAEKKLAQKRATLAAIASAAPAPSRENATQIESDLVRAQTVLAAMQSELRGHGPAAERLKAAKPPATRT